jgi:hypothetical protein
MATTSQRGSTTRRPRLVQPHLPLVECWRLARRPLTFVVHGAPTTAPQQQETSGLPPPHEVEE